MIAQIILLVLIVWLAVSFRIILKRISKTVAPYKEPFWVYFPKEKQVHIYFRGHRKIIEDINSIQEAKAYLKRDDQESNLQQL